MAEELDVSLFAHRSHAEDEMARDIKDIRNIVDYSQLTLTDDLLSSEASKSLRTKTKLDFSLIIQGDKKDKKKEEKSPEVKKPRHKLRARLFCGLSCDIRGNAHFLEERVIIHPIGRVIVKENLADATQQYVRLPDSGKEINIMAISPNREILAVAEKSAERPTIAVYNMVTRKRLKLLGNPIEDCTARYFAVLTFTADSKSIVAVIGEPDWLLIFYSWERGCIESHCKALYKRTRSIITQVACHPYDRNICVMVGNDLFRMMNCIDNTWQQYGYKRAENVQVTGVCWISPVFTVAGTKDGRLFVVEYSDLKGVYRAADVNELDLRSKDEIDGKPIVIILDSSMLTAHDFEGVHEVRALTAYTDGFAYSCSTGMIVVFERAEKTKYNTKWVRKGIYSAVGPIIGNLDSRLMDQVRYISISPEEKTILCTTNRNEIFLASLVDPNLFANNPIAKFKRFFDGFHQGPIATITSSIWKTLFMSVGLVDRTAIVWDYRTREMQFRKEFQDEIYSASIHPTGFYCLIGFTDKLKLLMIFIDNMRTIRHVDIKACPLVEFSRGGHVFAAVNGVYIEIFSSVTFKRVHILKGHVGPVRSIHFYNWDNKLYSCGQEGSVYRWDLSTGVRELDLYTNLNGNFDIVATKSGELVYFVGTDGTMKELFEGEVIRSLQLHQYSLYTLALSNTNEMMFAAGEKGAILSIAFPVLTPISYREYVMHTCPVKKILITYDESTLISISEDGALCIWDIIYPGTVEPPDINVGFRFLSEVVVNYEEWKEKKKRLKDMKRRLDEIDEENEYIMRQVVATHEIAIKETHRGYIASITDLQNKIKLLEKTHLKDVGDCNTLMTTTRAKYVEEIEALETAYGSKVADEAARSESMLIATRKFMYEYWDKLKTIEKASQGAMEELAKEKNTIILEKIKQIYCLRRRIDELKLLHEDIKAQIEDDCDREITELRTRFEIKIAIEEEKNAKLASENGLVLKRSNLLDDRILTYRLEISTLKAEQEKLKQFIKTLYREIQGLRVVIQDKEWLINQKNMLVVKSKRNTENFEKEKFVRGVRIEGLRERLEPTEMQLNTILELYHELEGELDERTHTIYKKNKTIDALTKRIGGLNKELKMQRELRDDADHMVKKLKSEIHACAAVAFEPDALKQGVLNMFNRYVSRHKEEESKHDIETSVEFLRQRRHLEASVRNLKSLINRKPRLIIRFRRTSSEATRIHVANLMKQVNCLRDCWRAAKRRALLLERITGIDTETSSFMKAKEKFDQAIKSTNAMEKECKKEIWDYKIAVKILVNQVEELTKKDITSVADTVKEKYGPKIGKRFELVVNKRDLTPLEEWITDISADEFTLPKITSK